MLTEEHGPKLGKPFGRILERRQDHCAFVDCEREQLHVVVEGDLELVGELVGADRPDRPGELRDGVGVIAGS